MMSDLDHGLSFNPPEYQHQEGDFGIRRCLLHREFHQPVHFALSVAFDPRE